MPKSKSTMRLSERRERARDLFNRGYTVVDVARELKVSRETAGRYKREYEATIRQQARDNPHMLSEVLENTIRTLNELDQVRAEAWQNYEKTLPPNAKQGYLNTVLKAQSERAKLLGVLGVKQEFLAHVEQVRILQADLIEFMRTELCIEDREKLEELLQSRHPRFIQSRPAVTLSVGGAEAPALPQAS